MRKGNNAPPGGSSDRRLTLLATRGIVLLGLLAFVALAIRFFPYTIDDSYITFRYASNFARGQGMVFNPGDQPRAEGITSLLYAAILSLAPITGVDIVALSKLLGLLACILTAGVIGVIIYKTTLSVTSLSSMSATMISCSGAMYYLSNPFVVGNAVSGMETSLAALAYGAFLFLVLRTLSSGSQPSLLTITGTGLTATLVPMFRPEMGLAVIITLAIIGLTVPEIRRPLWPSVAIFLLLGTSYFFLRYAYYGLPFPLPFYVKQGSFGLYSLHGVPDVLSYLRQEVFLLPLVLFCLAFALGPQRSAGKQSCIYFISVLTALGVQLAYYGTITPIMGAGYRYFQPISVSLVSMAFVGSAILYEVACQSGLKEKFSLPLLFTSLVGVSILSTGISPESQKLFMSNPYAMSRVSRIAQTMKKASGGTDIRIALYDCGLIPFSSGFSTLDLAGLNNRAIALTRKPGVALDEIRKGNPKLIFLIAYKKHGLSSLKGYEGLTSEDLIQSGYEYVGTMSVNPDYHYLVFARTDEVTKSFLKRLEKDGVLSVPPTKSHPDT